MTFTLDMQTLAAASRSAARDLARLDGSVRSSIIDAMADGIDRAAARILRANRLDVDAAEAAGLSAAMIDRLQLHETRLAAVSQGLREIAALPDPLDRTLRIIDRSNGLKIHKVSAPLGVIMVIYESRPNVTADAAALCLKAGNAVILKGGSESLQSNQAILDAMLAAARERDLPEHAVQLVATTDRAIVRELLSLDQYIDLVIPRGGEGLIRAVADHARMPVMKHSKGVCHVYVDRAANRDMAVAVAVNAKCQRPGVCNAMETLLVHKAVAESFLPVLGAELSRRKVELRCDEQSHALIPGSTLATDADWHNEYLDLILNVHVVRDLDAAIDHIERYGSRHSDAIVTDDAAAAERFTHEVDSAAVYVNASTRFTDGREFGMGAEIGVSTDKFHARGPCGIEELTTYKYVVHGTGQIRQ